MRIAADAPAWLVIVLLLLLALAAIEDAWRLRVSHLMVLGVAASGVAAMFFAGIGWAAWEPLLFAVAVLVIGTPLFAAGWIGGGDIKLFAASALWFMRDGAWRMFVAVAIAGGILTLIALITRRLPVPASVRDRVALLKRGTSIPYAIAISAGVGATVLWAGAGQVAPTALWRG